MAKIQTDPILAKLEAGEFTIEEGTGSAYTPVDVRIVKLIGIKGQDARIDHPLVKKADQKSYLVAAYLEIKKETDTDAPSNWHQHLEVGSLLRQDNSIAIYPTYENKTTGKKTAGTLLYDLIHAAKEHPTLGEKQKELFAEGTPFDLKKFPGVQLKMRAKFGKTKEGDRDYIILETSRQKIADEEYAQTRGNSNDYPSRADVDSLQSPQTTVNAVEDDDELPF